MNDKTLVIGWDSATWSVIMPLLEQNKLPNLARLIKNGVSGVLRSTIPPMTPLAWMSIVTGVNPGKHGIYDFASQDHETYRVMPISYSKLSRPALWNILNSHGRKVGVVNFPLAFPPPEVVSFFISGISAPQDTEVFTYPASLMNLLREKDYRIYPKYLPSDGDKRYLDAVKDLTDKEVEVSISLMKEEDWEIMLVVFMGTDWVQHFLWDKEIEGNKAVHEFYQYIDGKLGEMLSEAEDDWSVMVISDHGAREIRGEIHLNSLLEDWGYLKRAEVSRSIGQKSRRSMIKTGQKIGRRLPRSIKRWVKRNLVSDNIQADMREIKSEQPRLHYMIDWNNTKAFSYGYMGRIYINRSGKYPSGIVSSDQEYESLCEEITNRLKSLKNPGTGELVVGEVFRGKEIYKGDEADNSADIVFTPNDHRYMTYGDFGSGWFHLPSNRVADHDTEGIFVMKGKNIKRGIKIDAQVADITPTLLYLHDLPIFDDMDGQVLLGALNSNFTNDHEIKVEKYAKDESSQKTWQQSEEEQKKVEDRLRDLGYL